ncbi:hypothetical protein GCM10007879_14600 [Maritalea porphyrae]|uniref:DUF4214 domain-containing protein n=2 Tax=Maritalea porphyrae TaxID=880732 RepID=A0ABQ5US53_9HYPH|nr:hypothetical protein GCM10007879_14600 [Maritalea porphyrae]
MGIKEDITKIYVGYYDRAPDPDGLNYWIGRANAGMTLAEIANSFAVQTESTTKYPYLANPLVASADSFIDSVYMNLFNRAPDTAGKAYWLAELAGGKPVGQMIIDIMSGAKDDANGNDLTTLNNKVTAGVDWATDLANVSGLDYENNAAAKANAAAVLDGVTDDAATVTAAAAATDAFVAGGAAPSQSFTLTTAIDTFTGGAGADTFNADDTGTDVASTADTLNGGDGVDTLNIFSDGSASALPALTSVEKLNVYDQDADFDVSASAQASLTEVNLLRGDGDMKLTVGKNVATVGLTDIALKDAGGNNGITIAAHADATAITVGLNNVSVDNTGDDDVVVTGAKLETVTFKASGTKSTTEDLNAAGAKTVAIDAAVDLTAGAVVTSGADATLNITGAGKATIGQLDNDFDTVDASGNTGGVVLTVAADNKDAKITLGAGKDTVTTDDDGFAAADKFAVDAGAGEDTLVVAADADVSTADEAGRYTNFEVIQRDTNSNLDMSVFGASTTITKASIGDGGLTKMQAALAGDITLTADNAGSTFSLSTATGTSDVLSVTAAHATATTSADLTTATIDGFETLNFVANSGDKDLATATDLTAVSFTSAADLKTVNLTGSKAVDLNASANAVKVTAIDASGVTGGAKIATGGQTGALVVTGSAAKDEITIGTVGAGGTTTVNAGAADDKVIGTQANVAAATIDGGAGSDTVQITDANATTATLTVADSTFNTITNVETIEFTGAIAGDLTWTLGGFANTLATNVGGTLGIKAHALATGAAADDVNIDASALTGTNAVSVDLKNTDATAGVASDINVTGADGNDTIKVEEVTAASANLITLNGGKGDDTITVVSSATHDGAIVVNGGDGNDTIDVSGATGDAAVTANLITGGKGNDIIKLDTEGAATDFTIVTAATAADNGTDTITNFTLGAGGDVLDIDAFLNATAMNGKLTVNPGASSSVENDVNLLVDIAGGEDITTAAGLTAALAVGGEYANIDMANSAKAVFVTAASSDAGVTQNVFFATSDAGGNITATLVGTIGSSDIDDFVAANFNI